MFGECAQPYTSEAAFAEGQCRGLTGSPEILGGGVQTGNNGKPQRAQRKGHEKTRQDIFNQRGDGGGGLSCDIR